MISLDKVPIISKFRVLDPGRFVDGKLVGLVYLILDDIIGLWHRLATFCKQNFICSHCSFYLGNLVILVILVYIRLYSIYKVFQIVRETIYSSFFQNEQNNILYILIKLAYVRQKRNLRFALKIHHQFKIRLF